MLLFPSHLLLSLADLCALITTNCSAHLTVFLVLSYVSPMLSCPNISFLAIYFLVLKGHMILALSENLFSFQMDFFYFLQCIRRLFPVLTVYWVWGEEEERPGPYEMSVLFVGWQRCRWLASGEAFVLEMGSPGSVQTPGLEWVWLCYIKSWAGASIVLR